MCVWAKIKGEEGKTQDKDGDMNEGRRWEIGREEMKGERKTSRDIKGEESKLEEGEVAVKGPFPA